ncbi:MAG TPA: hypothetical protein VGD60_02800 [Candidatus Acidoferrales bacterium]
MSTSAVRVLVVGPTTSSTTGILKKLARAGWGSHAVASAREAETVLKTIRFKVVLSSEKLPDGMGYEMAPLIARQGGSLFIGVTLSETCLWLPVIEKGERSLGKRAMNPTTLEAEVSELLRLLKATEPAEPKDFKPASLPLSGSNDVRQTAVLYFERGGVDFLTNLNGNGAAEGTLEGLQTAARKNAMPPRRKFEDGGPGPKRLQSVPPGEAKPPTGTHGKLWRG